jgi:hypothetical protein
MIGLLNVWELTFEKYMTFARSIKRFQTRVGSTPIISDVG